MMMVVVVVAMVMMMKVCVVKDLEAVCSGLYVSHVMFLSNSKALGPVDSLGVCVLTVG